VIYCDLTTTMPVFKSKHCDYARNRIRMNRFKSIRRPIVGTLGRNTKWNSSGVNRVPLTTVPAPSRPQGSMASAQGTARIGWWCSTERSPGSRRRRLPPGRTALRQQPHRHKTAGRTGRFGQLGWVPCVTGRMTTAQAPYHSAAQPHYTVVDHDD